MKVIQSTLVLSAAVLLLTACSKQPSAIQQAVNANESSTAQSVSAAYELPTGEEIQQKRLDWLARSRMTTAESTARN